MFRAYIFKSNISDSFIYPAEALVKSLKDSMLKIGITEMMLSNHTNSLSFFIFSEDNAVPSEKVIPTLVKTINLPSDTKNRIEVLQERDGVNYFFEKANGLLSGINQIQSIKHFSEDFNRAKEFLLIGPVMQRLFQRSIWLHEKIRLNSRYFNIKTNYASVFSELAEKIFEKLSNVTVQISRIDNVTSEFVSELVRLGCRRFYYSADSQDLEKLKANLPGIISVVQTNTLISDVDILISSNKVGKVIKEEEINRRIAERNNNPFLILTDEVKANEILSKKYYNTFLYGFSDLDRILDQNRTELKKIIEEIRPWLVEEVESFYSWLAGDSRYRFLNIIGQSPKMQELFELISRISQSDISVLIQGESGTGKELVAQAIHRLSQRSERAFVAVNCGAIPENLLESELFGHVKGSFTGAIANKNGLFLEAHKGTIFLDEIAELPQHLQVKLLRFLQDSDIKPVGSNETVRVDVRVLAATNKNLDNMVDKGLFRSDLYYRLNVIMLDLPPLRKRRDDITILIDHFLKKYATKINKDVSSLSKNTLNYLKNYNWPGNVRELENAIERAVALSVGSEITEYELPSSVKPKMSNTFSGNGFNKKLTLKDMEKKHILNVLKETNHDYEIACKILGIGRTTLWRKLKEYNVDI